jgi:Na+/H+ antiporter NhaA
MDPVWRDWLLTWPLLLFFFAIGQELRIEISRHTDRRHLIAPICAALGGMLVPAAIYLGLSLFSTAPKAAWGIPMATDLPFVLLALAIFPSHVQRRIRIFLLALAIADDIGSILILGVVTSTHGGIHPTIIGATLGLLWGARGYSVMKKIGYYVALPLFLVASVSTTFIFSWKSVTNPLVWQLILARSLGKPIGILMGALIGYTILRMTHEHVMRLKIRELVISGFIATFGLDVALIFANVALTSPDQKALAIMGIFLTIPVSITGVMFARYFLTSATAA